MGGTNEKTIAGMRMHVNSGSVHIHDDRTSLKFAMGSEAFKSEIENVLDDDPRAPDGVTVIKADEGSDLCVGQHNGKVFAFLLGKTNVKSDLLSFIKGC